MALTVGIKHLRDGIEPQSTIGSEMGVLGIVGTAPNADPAKFPLNKSRYLRTSDPAARAALGLTGTLPQALEAASAQVSGSARALKVVLVRVEEGADAVATIVNMLGSEANRTGVWALLDAPIELGITPRVLITPGYTSQTHSGLADPVITAPGASGANGTFALGFTGGTGSGAAGTFTVAGGSLASVAITDRGSYTAAPSLSFTASAGLTGATATVGLEQLANALCATMPTIAERLNGVFIPEGPTSSRQAWLDWLETLPASPRLLHPLRQDAKVLDAGGNIVTRPLSPFIAAVYPRRDSEKDGVPSGSALNQPIYGLVGVSPAIHLSLTDETSEGQGDLEVSGGIVARGESGVEDAPGATGFTFWGSDTMSSNTDWLFAHVVRMRDYIELGNVRTHKSYLGKYNITLQTVEAVMNTLRAWFTKLAAGGHILKPWKIDSPPDFNTSEELRLGEIDISFAVEEPPVLRKLVFRSRRHRAALEALTQQISLQLNSDNAA